MRFADYSKGYVLKLEPGEEIHEILKEFVLQKRIPSAFFQGIGGVTNVELGYFDLKKNDYTMHNYDGDYELISASGNISAVDGKPFVHAHVVLSDEKCHTISGHFFKGTVTITVEIFLFPLDIVLIQKPSKKLHFKELDLPHHFVK